MARVMTFGTFDILHPGHLSYLKQAKELGKELVVVVATNANVEKIKGKKPVNSEEHRRELVEAISIVDKAVIGTEGNMLDIVEEIKPDVIALGYDQKPGEEELAKKLEEKGINAGIVRLEPYREDVYKSSKIKEQITKGRSEH